MTIHPKKQKDLLLAPVAVEIDLNLQRMRNGTRRDVLAELEVELDRLAVCAERSERAELVLRRVRDDAQPGRGRRRARVSARVSSPRHPRCRR